MKIYLIRHGQSEANLKKLNQGQLNSPLTQLGIDQAKKLGERFKEINDFEIIYSSDLQRAHDTAIAVKENHSNIELITDKRLRERSHGDFAGTTKNPNPYDQIEGGHRHEKRGPNGGENMHDVYDRVSNFLIDVLQDEKNIVIVSHGGTMKAIIRYLTDGPFTIFQTYKVDNTSVFEIEIKDDNVHFILENCTKHLES